MLFLRCAISLVVCAIFGASTECPSRTLIMADLENKEFTVEVIRKMRHYQAMDPRLSGTVLATMLYSIEKHTEFLVPWSSNMSQVEERVATFQKPGAFNSFQLPNSLTEDGPHQSTQAIDNDDTRRIEAATIQTSLSISKDLLKRSFRKGTRINDPLLQQVKLGLKFFRPYENGMILLLTSSKTMSEDTKLSQDSLKARNITVVVGYTAGNTHLAEKESEELLKFVEISHDARVKQSSIARFLLYSHCTSPELVKEIQAVRSQPLVISANSSQLSQPNGSPTSSEDSRKSTAIAAGSVAAASAGVAAISVFAGRWLYKRSDGDVDGDYSNSRYSGGGGERLEADGERVYETPVAHDQSSLDIDSHTTPEIRRTDTDSSVQHIAFTMF